MTDVFATTFKFTLLSANFSTWKFCDVHKNDVFVVLRDLGLSLKEAEKYLNNSPLANTVVWTAAAGCIIQRYIYAEHMKAYGARNELEKYDKNLKLAKEELEKTGKIKGFELLNLRSFDKLWISHYDLENFNK